MTESTSKVSASGYVLTGGKSTRMGADKALLELGGVPLAARACNLLEQAGVGATLVGRRKDHEHLGFTVIEDVVVGKGPLAGIVTALRHTPTDWVLILACDLPYAESRFLLFLLEVAAGGVNIDAVVPRTEDGWHPLCAVYHRRCLPAFEKVLDTEYPKVSVAFAELRVRAVVEDDWRKFDFPANILENVNAPEQYEAAQRRFEAQEHGPQA